MLIALYMVVAAFLVVGAAWATRNDDLPPGSSA